MTDDMMNADGEDMFFDTVDSLSAMDSVFVIDENVGSDYDYDLWMSRPRSIHRRKVEFLRRMELGEFRGFGDKDLGFERVIECSGAVSLSGLESFDECVVSVGREMEDEALSHFEDLDLHDSIACCNEVSTAKVSKKVTNVAKPMRRWWSYLRKKPIAENVVKSGSQTIKMKEMKVYQNKKKFTEFSSLYVGQELKAHEGFILTMKFSPDGQYLASGGQDGVVRIWRVFLKDTFAKYSVPNGDDRPKTKFSNIAVPDKIFHIDELPYQELHGHTGDILNLAWSKRNCLLSSSKDKTVRLWKVGSDDCLNVYYHNDYVTSIQFNPVDDTHFISGSIDGKVRIWNVSNGRVVDWVYPKDVITAVSYKPDGQGFVVGSISGVCRFYKVDASKEHIQIEAQVDIHGRKKTSHNKITGIEFSHKEHQRIMITSEDSKVSILDGIHTTHKYKGHRNSGSQMSASLTSTGKHIISVGEDSQVYIWKYDSRPSSNSKYNKSIHSCEHFFSDGVSVALPWLGNIAHYDHLRESPRSQRHRGADGFSLGSWFSIDNQCCNGRAAAATWPEEQLPIYAAEESEDVGIEHEMCKMGSEAWNVVIVTGSLDGRIRTFHNFGVPSS